MAAFFVSSYIKENSMLECILDYIGSLLPEGFNLFDMLPTLGFIIAVVFILAVLIRIIADKASRYNHALASAMAILFVYMFLMLIHNESAPGFTKEALEILPLVDYKDSKITLFAFSGGNILEVFKEFLYAFILSFILIGLDDLIPDAKNGLAWIVLQVGIAFISVFLYWGVLKAINVFLPGVLDSYAPLILGCILLFMIALGVMKLILGLLLVAVNPLLGAISAFFGTSPVGKALGKAALCALILCAVAFFIGNSGLTTFQLADLNFVVCVMPMLVLLLLWFVVGYIL